MWNPPSTLASVSYLLLVVAIVSLRFGVRVWVPVYLGAIVAAYAAGVLALPGVLAIALMAGICYLERRSQHAIAQLCSFAAIVILALALGTHALPGFANPQVLDDVRLSAHAAPYSLYLNFDKTSAGLLIIGLCVPQLVAAPPTLLDGLKRALPIVLITLAVLIVASMTLGYLRFEPTWTHLFWLWAPVNLLFTCVSEEAFFRGYVQTRLEAALGSTKYAQPIALAVASVLFGLAHIAGGWTYVLLACMAGVGYGWVLQRTARLEWAILCHFTLNALHFLLFTYPFATA